MRRATMALLAVLAGSAPGARAGELRVAARSGPVSSLAPPAAWPRLASAAPGDSGPPPCLGDVCQPRVSVPGYEPRLSLRGKRTELAAHLLERAHLEPLASFSHFLVATGLRLDFTPAALDRSGQAARASGWGHVQLTLRWRIDAAGRPVWTAPR